MKGKKNMAIIALATMLAGAVYEIMRVVDESDVFKAKSAECEQNNKLALEPEQVEGFMYNSFDDNDVNEYMG